MSPRLKRLSGRDVVSILADLGFVTQSQRGSHAKLRRVLKTGEKQTLTIPIHDKLDIGTLRAIMKQATRYVPQELLQPYFYSE
jgi:predicted RNA binding protein YcfA (HicA-like mRNA interferase family)